MTTLRLLVLIVLCVMWPSAAHAQSDVLDWVAQLSGPGPFHNHFKGYDLNVLCYPVSWNCLGNDGVDELDSTGKSDAKLIVRFGNSFASTGTQQLFQDDPNDKRDVAQQIVSTLVMYRANRIVDVGAGFQWVQFSSSDAPSFSFWRTGYVPAAMRVTPLGLINATGRWRYARRLIHLDAQSVWYSEGFTSANFNNTASKFSVGAEYQTRLSFLIDGVAAARVIRGK